MLLTFKDLKQQKFTLEAEPSNTIAQIKEKIFKTKEENGDWAPALQKLIYSGKILADDKTVEFYKVEEKGFIVCMLSKPKVATPAKEPSTPAQISKPATPPAPAPVASTSSEVPATPSPAGVRPSANFNDPSALAMGPQLDAAITNMVEMGFPRDQIDRAMRAAFNNPDRAVEYLMSGIPGARPRPTQGQASPSPVPSAPSGDEQQAIDPASENVNLFEAAAAAAANRSGSGGARSGGGQGGVGLTGGAGGTGDVGLAGLDFLRNNPQFQQLRQLVQESPGMLEPILQQVGLGNPQLAALISQNPDAFLSLLGEGAGLQISVTPEEAAAIDRLCALGFSRDSVIQAYIACDKNEELTANYLFDNGDEDDMGGA